MAEYTVVGKGLPRIDGPEKATGRAVFTVDLKLPGMLHGKILRSPHPHARIISIDSSAAEKLPGVKAVITGKDISAVRYAFVDTPRYPADERPLAVDKVRYIGDEVAAVAAVSEAVAEEALALIKVQYEVLPAAFTPEEAVMPGAPVIHENTLEGTSAWEDWGAAGRAGDYRDEVDINNASARSAISFGDIEEGFRQADHIREDRFETAATAHCALEPHAAVASYDPVNGKLDLWLSTMGIFLKRFVLSKALKLPISKVRVRHSYVGGAFGGKIDVFPYEFCAAYLSMKLGRPVKFELDREEVFTTTRQRHPITVNIKTGVKKDGTIVAQDIKVYADNGGYRGSGAIVVFLCHGFSFPIYKVPNYRYEGIAVYTNNPIRGPQRGHGAPQIRFAIDSQLDLLARDIGLDPVEMMLKNVRHKGDILPNGDRLNSCGLTEAIKGASEGVNWAAGRRQFVSGAGTGIKASTAAKGSGKDGTRFRRGVGISVCSMFSGAMYYPFASAAMVKLHDDGSATLFTGSQELGQGCYTTLAQVAAEELGIGLEDIRLVAGDTELTPIDLGSFLSGGALVTGNAVKLAAEDARRQLLEVAAEILEVRVEELGYKDKQIYVRENPAKSIPYGRAIQASIFRKNGNPIIGSGSYKGYPETDRYPSLAKGKGLFTSAYGFAAQAVEVEVDTLTGKVRVLRAATFHDCGFPLNKTIVEGQVQGCVSMGMGQALSEEIVLEKGQLFNASFLNYRLPIATDTPETLDDVVESLEPNGPFGAKEVGEGSVAGMLAAVANAVHDAVGVRIYSTPITPEKVLSALEC